MSLEELKKMCRDNNVELSYMVYLAFLITELGNSFKPSVDQIDDLYAGIVGGVFNAR